MEGALYKVITEASPAFLAASAAVIVNNLPWSIAAGLGLLALLILATKSGKKKS